MCCSGPLFFFDFDLLLLFPPLHVFRHLHHRFAFGYVPQPYLTSRVTHFNMKLSPTVVRTRFSRQCNSSSTPLLPPALSVSYLSLSHSIGVSSISTPPLLILFFPLSLSLPAYPPRDDGLCVCVIVRVTEPKNDGTCRWV